MADFFQAPFLVRALITAVIVGMLAGYYGGFVVQRGMGFLGSGLAHSAFGGVAIGLLFHTSPLLVSLPFTILIALAITFVRNRSVLDYDTTVGIFFSIAMALGIVVLSLRKESGADAMSYLFGSILWVDLYDLLAAVGLFIFSLGSLPLWKRWAYTTFDEELASADGVWRIKDDYILSVVLAVTIVVSVKIAGVVLIAALLVIPAATARLMSKTFSGMTLLSVLLGGINTGFGILVSYFFDLPGGAGIILTHSLIFIATLPMGFRRA